MMNAQKRRRVERAGHRICGDGSFPVRAHGKDSNDPRDKVFNEDGHATVLAYRSRVAFLKSALEK
jgi:hypothetical protein